MTTEIVRSSSIVCVESLNISGMIKNRKLSQSLSDASLGEILRQLKYKCEWSGKTLIEADRFFPSSKKCSSCGSVKKHLELSERVYHCDECGFEIDRDLNAAMNLKQLYLEK